MSNHFFQFKKFTVYQDRCAMKVGTDGVLLGALAPVEQVSNILDIGMGTGLVSLMLAQRCAARITGVEIDTEAAAQARENIQRSMWSERIEVVETDFACYTCEIPFDSIVSNPPYFDGDLRCPNSRRNAARHTDTLSFEVLLRGVNRLMDPKGRFTVILPAQTSRGFEDSAFIYGLYPAIRYNILTKSSAEPKRVVTVFGRTMVECQAKQVVMTDGDNHYTDEYRQLVQDYYLTLK